MNISFIFFLLIMISTSFSMCGFTPDDLKQFNKCLGMTSYDYTSWDVLYQFESNYKTILKDRKN